MVNTRTLSSGLPIPAVGLGTWLIEKDADACRAVKDAIEAGFRHIDSAEDYGNEAGVGKGVRECGLPREDIFVTTKLKADIKTYGEAVKAVDLSLKKLGTGYIDLMLIHSPQPWSMFRKDERSFDEGNRQAWRALEEACGEGKIRSIGVSNFEREDIENILFAARIKPVVNQIPVYVGNVPRMLLDWCSGVGILCEAYSPLAHGRLLTSDALSSVAEKYGVTVAQLCLRYTLQLGTVTLPKTTDRKRMDEDLSLDFQISEEDMNLLDGARFDEKGNLHLLVK